MTLMCVTNNAEGGAMNEAVFQGYEPVSLCPAAPGWRAVFMIDVPQGREAWPVAAWGIFQVKSPPEEGGGPPLDEGRHVIGLVATDMVHCVHEMANFWHYRGPDDPDPSAERSTRPGAALAALPMGVILSLPSCAPGRDVDRQHLLDGHRNPPSGEHRLGRLEVRELQPVVTSLGSQTPWTMRMTISQPVRSAQTATLDEHLTYRDLVIDFIEARHRRIATRKADNT